ncbi:hypothetical protein C6P45_004330, partial [Maudiozyma exigua]
VTEMEQTILDLKTQNSAMNNANAQLRGELAAATAQFQDRVETLNRSITSKLANLDNKVSQQTVNPGTPTTTNKETVLADLRQNFVGLILDENDPRLIGCTKTYGEVRFTPSAEEFLTTTSDFETKIRVIQRDLLYKKVRYADWTMHLATLCDDAMELALRGADTQFLSWSDA